MSEIRSFDMYSTKALEFNLILDRIREYAYSNQANALLEATKPSNDFETVVLNLNYVNELKTIITSHGKLPFVKGFDLDQFMIKLEKLDYLNIEDFVKLRRFIHMEQSLEGYFKAINPEFIHYLVELKSFKHLKEPLLLIDEIIKPDETIFDHASTTLKNIRHELKVKERQLDKLLSEVLIRYQNYVNEAIIVMRNGRYVIPIKESYKNKVKGVIHDVSASKQTVYIEPDDLRQVTQDIEYLNKQEAQEIIQICMILTHKLKGFINEFNEHFNWLIHLDVLHAKAQYDIVIDGKMPEINQKGN